MKIIDKALIFTIWLECQIVIKYLPNICLFLKGLGAKREAQMGLEICGKDSFRRQFKLKSKEEREVNQVERNEIVWY